VIRIAVDAMGGDHVPSAVVDGAVAAARYFAVPSEGLVDTVEALLGDELQGTFSSQVGYLLLHRAFRRVRPRVDYSEYEGALLLGVAGLAIVEHGRSSAKTVRNAIAMAHRFATSGFVQRVEREIVTSEAPDL
jgi:glycerol-3-phosphate acyltransferase PlsX